MEELIALAGGRAGWSAGEAVAVFALDGGGWSAQVRPLVPPGRRVTRFHVAIIDPQRVARYTTVAFTARDAVALAERQVRHR